jgi:hypothetical protein
LLIFLPRTLFNHTVLRRGGSFILQLTIDMKVPAQLYLQNQLPGGHHPVAALAERGRSSHVSLLSMW